MKDFCDRFEMTGRGGLPTNFFKNLARDVKQKKYKHTTNRG